MALPSDPAVGARLLKERVVLLGTPIDDAVAATVIAQLLFLSMENGAKPMDLYLNSPGGSVTGGLAILDTMDFVKCPVRTCCIGASSGMATLLLAHGAAGHRRCLPHARIGFGPLRGGPLKGGDDARTQAAEIATLTKRVLEVLAKDSGWTPAELEREFERDRHFTPAEALDFGLVDRVVEKAP